MTRLNGSEWTGKYTQNKTTYTRKFRGFADYETIETPSQFTINVTALGIEKTSGSTTQMVANQVKTATLEVKNGNTSLGTVGTTNYTDNMSFPSTAPYEIKISDGGQIVINKTASEQTVKLILNASKVDNAWKGSSSVEEEIVVPAYSKPTVSLTINRNANETTASVTASVSSFVGDTISNFKLTVGGATQTLTGGTIPASGTITRSLTVSGLVLGSVTAKLVATGLGGQSQEITRTLPSAFYTMDIGANGKEIAFGASASGDTVPDNGLFKCGMDVLLKDGHLIDYPIERGVSSDWNYTKYASGEIVLNRFISKTSMKLTNSTSGTYYDSSETSDRTTLTVPLVTSIYSVMTQDAINGSTSHTSGVYVYETQVSGTRVTVKFRAHASSSSASGGCYIEVKGKWK